MFFLYKNWKWIFTHEKIHITTFKYEIDYYGDNDRWILVGLTFINEHKRFYKGIRINWALIIKLSLFC